MTVAEQRPIGLLGQEETFDRVTPIVSFPAMRTPAFASGRSGVQWVLSLGCGQVMTAIGQERPLDLRP